ncbi:hypothetical protein CMUS01_13288 [Colletotrichum musicola]|uniref:Uncharacterized protein n=1 Tax=Colletotrichum musicola TaxID=2175873 RepID=A0A8H6JEU7_9PEZI|nr:hypothetical protein CMUS01_13288 [Colletotrichum musicola]
MELCADLCNHETETETDQSPDNLNNVPASLWHLRIAPSGPSGLAVDKPMKSFQLVPSRRLCWGRPGLRSETRRLLGEVECNEAFYTSPVCPASSIAGSSPSLPCADLSYGGQAENSIGSQVTHAQST